MVQKQGNKRFRNTFKRGILQQQRYAFTFVCVHSLKHASSHNWTSNHVLRKLLTLYMHTVTLYEILFRRLPVSHGPWQATLRLVLVFGRKLVLGFRIEYM